MDEKMKKVSKTYNPFILFKEMKKNNLYFLMVFLIGLFGCNAQMSKQVSKAKQSTEKTRTYSPENQKIFNDLRARDSLLFSLGFNECDTSQLRILISEDFEFYHDQSGVTESKENFILGISGLCHMDYKATRELAQNSLAIHPLYNNGQLYGAIQTGEHLFYGQKGEAPKYLTSTAKFTHLWILEAGDWKLKRVLSYDHVPASQVHGQ